MGGLDDETKNEFRSLLKEREEYKNNKFKNFPVWLQVVMTALIVVTPIVGSWVNSKIQIERLNSELKNIQQTVQQLGKAYNDLNTFKYEIQKSIYYQDINIEKLDRKVEKIDNLLIKLENDLKKMRDDYNAGK